MADLHGAPDLGGMAPRPPSPAEPMHQVCCADPDSCGVCRYWNMRCLPVESGRPPIDFREVELAVRAAIAAISSLVTDLAVYIKDLAEALAAWVTRLADFVQARSASREKGDGS